MLLCTPNLPPFKKVGRFFALALFFLAPTFVYAQAPVIGTVVPNHGKPGDTVTINGANFDATATNNIVWFGATQGHVISATTTALHVIVDTGATRAPVSVLNTTSHLQGIDTAAFDPTYINTYFFAGSVNFKPHFDISTGATGLNPYVACMGDLDGDGKTDLVVNCRGSNKIEVLQNISTPGSLSPSSFGSPVSYTTPSTPTNVKLADMDGDGKLDAITANTGGASVSVLLNNSTLGAPSFATHQDFSTLGTGTGDQVLTIADFDGDGKLDIAVTTYVTNNIILLRNTSTGPGFISFAAPQSFTTPTFPFGITAADLDGDGKPDLAVTDTTALKVSIFRNTSVVGSGVISFAPRVDYNSGHGDADITAADINGDGKMELIVTNSYSSSIYVYQNNSTPGTVNFVLADSMSTGTNAPVSVTTGDVDGDGKADILVTAVNGFASIGCLYIYRNHFSGSFTTTTFDTLSISYITTGSSPSILPSGVTIGDLDGDTYPDVVLGNNYTPSISIFRNYPLPINGPVTGPDTVCYSSGPFSYADTSAGGFWSVSNPSLATISSTGVLSPTAPGTIHVQYSKVAGGDTNMQYHVVVMEPHPAASIITGAASVCPGSTITLADSIAGGSWTGDAPTIGTIGMTNGAFHGVSLGTVHITYTVTNLCGMGSSYFTESVSSLPIVAHTTGTLGLCVSGSSTLSNTTPSGTWSSTNTAVATITTGGVVTAHALGSSFILYTVTGTCGTASDTVTFTVSGVPPTVTPITGTTTFCQTATSTLSSTATGGVGVWSSNNTAVATVNASGVVTGTGGGTAVIKCKVVNGCGADSVTTTVTINPLPIVAPLTGVATLCVSGTTTLSCTTTGGLWSSGATSIATVSGGTVTGVAVGRAPISYSVTNTCGTTSSVDTVTVGAPPVVGALSGPLTVCVGNNITLLDTTSGGAWTIASSAIATIAAGGIVHGVSNGSTTATYTVTNTCGPTAVTYPVNVSPAPNAGTISGTPTTICQGATTTLSETAPGGTWSVSPASVDTGVTFFAVYVVHGVAAGSAVVTYSVTNTCGTATTTYNLTTIAQPSAGTITGPSASVCTGQHLTLADAVTTGTWTCTPTSIATISATGVVLGVASGTATASYSVANSCGTATATYTVTVNPSPNAGTISGTTNYCLSSSPGTLTDAAGSGSWSSVTSSVATISTTGVVTPVAVGTSTISYTVTNGCGTVAATTSVSVSTMPNAGTITGPTVLCAGGHVTLHDATASIPGTWISGTTSVATILPSGVVTGVAAGTTIITYSVNNSCGTATTTYSVSVAPTANAGVITGPAAVCEGGASITLVDTASGGTGTWASSNTAAATVSSTGVVTGVLFGGTIISYTVSNGCGPVTATYTVTVDPLANAGFITGSPNVCQGGTDTLGNIATGGVWRMTNAKASITPSGVVSGLLPGNDTVFYKVTTGCGTDSTFLAMHITVGPYPGVVTGQRAICAGNSTLFTDTVTGGSWSSSAPTVASVSATGLVTGVSGGSAFISYSFTNSCGTGVSFDTITVYQLPSLTSSLTPPAICDNSPFVYVPTTNPAGASYVWTRASVAGIATSPSSGTGAINESLHNTTANAVNVIYVFVSTMGICSDTQHVTLAVKPTPTLNGILTGQICGGSTFDFTATSATAGTTFTWTRAAVSNITPITSSGTGNIHETLYNSADTNETVTYAYLLSANNCSLTEDVTVVVSPTVAPPAITTYPSSALCQGTDYMNFGIDSLTSGVTYMWSTSGIANIWATGIDKQYCLVNFDGVGTSYVYLTASLPGVNCSVKDSFKVVTIAAENPHVGVVYFNSDLICQDNTADSYQWGYEVANTLDSTLLSGETNQNYNIENLNRDLYYWVITKHGDCIQKNYYIYPVGIKNVNSLEGSFSAYPNPNGGDFKLHFTTSTTVKATAIISNLLGETIMQFPITSNQESDVHLNQPAGVYMVTVVADGERYTARVVISN